MAAVLKVFEAIGRRTANGFDEWGFAAALLAESILWVFVGGCASPTPSRR